jgi:cytoskeletal protein RodZ
MYGLLNFSGFTGLEHVSREVSPMTDSASSLMAILLGLGVFAIIVGVGWRSVQNRRIVRLQGADGKETIIVAGEDDHIDSVATTSETTQPEPAAAPSVVVVNNGVEDPAPAPEFGRKGRSA